MTSRGKFWRGHWGASTILGGSGPPGTPLAPPLRVQKIKNQKFSVIFEKSKVNFLLEVILFLWTKGF